MRVVAGSVRGRRLVAPVGRDVRPTSDRVREALFNALASLDRVRGAAVLDAFAGSGALGLEALSRGADHVTFCDRDRRTLAAVKANLASTGFEQAATVLEADVIALLERSDERLAGPFALVLADPPYAFDRWTDLLAALGPRLAHDAVVVLESDRAIAAGPAWRVLREKRYGGTVVVIVTPAAHPPTGARSEDLAP